MTGALRSSWLSRSSLALLLGLAATASASLCVWRQPDSDIAGIFGNGSYKTVFLDIGPAAKQRVEKRLGFALDPDETQFKFFPVYQGKKQVGTVMTHAGKGQFGAIEVVVAVVPTDSGVAVKEVRIQRDREKAKAALRSSKFLGQFKGMTAQSEFELGGRVKTAAPGAERASAAVARAVRKLLVAYEELVSGQGGVNR